METPIVYVCSSPADKDWAEKFLQSLRPTLGNIAAAAGGADENGAAGGGPATYRDALERSPLAILLTSPDFVSQFGEEGGAESSELMSLIKDRSEHGLTRQHHDFLASQKIAPSHTTMVGRVALERRTIHIPDITADSEYQWPQIR